MAGFKQGAAEPYLWFAESTLAALWRMGKRGWDWGGKPREEDMVKIPGEPRKLSVKSPCRAGEEGCFRGKSHGTPLQMRGVPVPPPAAVPGLGHGTRE